MAACKFADILQRNRTPKIAIILIYTFLEWALIALLLSHGFFSHLIARFTHFFGLKPPCVLCSRSYSDLVCDAHAADSFNFGALERTQKGKLEEEEGDVNLVCEEIGVEEIEEERKFFNEDCDEPLELITLMGGEKRVLGEAERWVPVELIDSSTLNSKSEERDFVAEARDESLKMAGDASLELIAAVQVENGLLGEGERWVPVELIDSSTLNTKNEERNLVVEDCDKSSKMVGDECLEFITLMREEGRFFSEEERWVPVELIDSSNLSTEKNGQIVHYQGNGKERDYVGYKHDENEDMAVDIGTVEEEEKRLAKSQDFGEVQASEEDSRVMDADLNCEISISSEIDDKEKTNLAHFNELAVPQAVCMNDQGPSSNIIIVEKEQVIEAEPIRQTVPSSNNGLFICTELNEFEEEKMAETPASIESISSETNENEVLTVDNLKDALKAERKTLRALYAELEEERSASAISADETMAMITRLQEEKAAMKVEVLHCQRMMDEQSEFDQEALQLLNELMMKKEKENQELEKELEFYKKKVLENDSTKHLSTLDESVDDLEEERLSILEQLKVLEKELFSMDDDDELKSAEHQIYSNKYDVNGDLVNSFEHDQNTNGKLHHEPRTMIKGGKSLLPLFDATIDTEREDGESNGSSQSNSKFVVDDGKRLAIAQEVDNVYQRLQALEADREFLKDCIRSLKKGDKGMDLLQEILQHLRDLRKIELNMNQR
ncbi:uncharacterized protein A4U43_C07F36820 [Asparagus officinalis]|uniref:GTD-binding domain-containing protein n=2 Tax=Asparagus officinalis TaxID=4686 RepID=A0A5P1ELG3_ASPOF|nr:myosin-binding protein 3-like isoform X2 [Asparagus officinalis]ONK65411.1 uncharacterized protein A4U43_C07F36820 [Asparagus officinalis]